MKKVIWMFVALAVLLSISVVSAIAAGPATRGIFSYELAEVMQVAGRQGVATDGKHYYISSSQALFKYTKEGKLVAENKEPFKDYCAECNHLGDIDVYKGEIYAGAEKFAEGRGWKIQIAVYDAESLEFKRTIPWNDESGQAEVSSMTVDPVRQIAWMSDWTDGKYLYQYDLTTGKFIGKLHLQPVPQYQQGIFYYQGYIYITADDGDANFFESDHLYKVNAAPGATHALVQLEKIFGEVTREGEIEGLCFDPKTGELLVLFNRGTKVVEGYPVGMYPGYEKEIHELYIYEVVKP